MIFSKFNSDGLSVIPLRARRKNPVLSGWQKYSKELATKELARLWDDLYTVPELGNIGLCPGPASGVMAVDIDTDDPRTHKAVPDSPFRRVGKPGREVRLYKYNPAIRSMKDHSRCIEVFADSGQIVLPPSIHPDTNEPYRWIGEMRPLDDEWREHLPEMPNLNWLERCPIINDGSDPTKVTGRNNRLTEVVCHIFSRGESVEYAIQEALKIDQEEHAGNEYFLDESDTYAQQAGGNREEAARLFCEDHYRRMKRKGMVPEPANIIIDLTNIEETAKQVFVPLPKAPGIIGEIQEDILRCSVVKQPQLALGTALSLVSVCSLGRFSWNDNWPNLFTMLVAPSGYGKDIPQKYIKAVLSHEIMEGENLYGLGGWQSSVAMTMDFPVQRFRIDVIDEFGGFIKDAAQGNNFKQSAMLLANELYSQKGHKFAGLKSATRAKETGACIGPGLSLIAAIQPDILSIAANKEMFDNGFLRRFLYFIADAPRAFHKEHTTLNVDATARKLKSIVMKRPALHSGAGIGGMNVDRATWQPNCLQMDTDNDAKSYLSECQVELFDLDERYHVRLTENSLRVAMLAAIANERTTVLREDISFGVELTKALAYNGQRLLKEASGGSFFDKEQSAAMRWLLEKKGGQCVKREFNNRFSRHTSRQRQELLNSLTERGLIVVSGQSITAVKLTID